LGNQPEVVRLHLAKTKLPGCVKTEAEKKGQAKWEPEAFSKLQNVDKPKQTETSTRTSKNPRP
jgi:hypothetical protein